MKLLSVLLIIFLATITNAQQLEIKINESTSYNSDLAYFNFTFTVTNVGNTTANFYWSTEKTPENLDCYYSVTDQVIHYPAGMYNPECDPVFKNSIEPGDSIKWYQITLNLEDNCTEAIIKYCFLTDCVELEHDTIICTQFKINENGFTSTSDNDRQKLEILAYPNPSDNVLRLLNDSQVSYIKIHSADGQFISKLKHQPQESHSISHLPRGLYFLEFQNNDGQKIDATRLLKI